MIDAGVPLCPANRTVDKMFYTGFFGSLREVLALLYFASRADLPEILDTINAVCALCGALERGRIFQVPLQHSDAATC